MKALTPVEMIEKKILLIRGHRVMIDSDIGRDDEKAERAGKAKQAPFSGGIYVPVDAKGEGGGNRKLRPP